MKDTPSWNHLNFARGEGMNNNDELRFQWSAHAWKGRIVD
jgi:hypothetical protein